MYLAVKLAAQCKDAPKGMPHDWPFLTVELTQTCASPPGPWIIMTPAQMAAYKEARQTKYQAWINSLLEDPEPPSGGE